MPRNPSIAVGAGMQRVQRCAMLCSSFPALYVPPWPTMTTALRAAAGDKELHDAGRPRPASRELPNSARRTAENRGNRLWAAGTATARKTATISTARNACAKSTPRALPRQTPRNRRNRGSRRSNKSRPGVLWRDSDLRNENDVQRTSRSSAPTKPTSPAAKSASIPRSPAPCSAPGSATRSSSIRRAASRKSKFSTSNIRSGLTGDSRHMTVFRGIRPQSACNRTLGVANDPAPANSSLWPPLACC